MTRFFCDRCGNEVEGLDDLIEVAVEGRERPNLASWMARSEMCRACFDSVKDAIGALLGGEDTRKKPRRAAS